MAGEDRESSGRKKKVNLFLEYRRQGKAWALRLLEEEHSLQGDERKAADRSHRFGRSWRPLPFMEETAPAGKGKEQNLQLNT